MSSKEVAGGDKGGAPLEPPNKRHKTMPREVTFTSGVKIDETRFQWRIGNFDLVRRDSRMIKDQKLQIEAGSSVNVPCTWVFYLTLTEAEQPSDDCIGIQRKLVSLSTGRKDICSSVCIEIRDKDGNAFFKQRSRMVYWETNQSKGFKNVLSKNEDGDKLPLIDGDLVINFKLKLYVTPIIASRVDHTTPEGFNLQAGEALRQDLSSMLLLNGPATFSDVKIITRDEKELCAHRAILAARSPVFHTMFHSRMTEEQTGVILMKDIREPAVRVLLTYLYTGCLDDNWCSSDVVVELTYAAGKYELTELLNFFNGILGKVAKEDNAVALLSMAEKLDLKMAEKELLDYIKDRALPNAKSYNDLISILGPQQPLQPEDTETE